MKREDFSLAEFQSKLDTIDFSLIRMKLCHSQHGSGWTEDKVARAEQQYRQYLTLHQLFGGTTKLVPTELADQFWHQHILDTRQYAKDCDELFGHFLHHFPYFGLRGEADEAALLQAGANTRSLAAQFFPTLEADMADCSGCSSCKSCSDGQ